MSIARSAIFICLVLLALPSSAFAEGRLTAKPNIVVIMTDDQDDMGSLDTMPKTRKSLMESGIRFTNSFVNVSVCLPSRVSFLTGQAWQNLSPRGYTDFALRESNSLGMWLQKAGYTTALMGKFMNFYGAIAPNHVVPGWNEWHAGVSEGGFFNYTVNENGVIVSYGSADADYGTDVLTRKGVGFINKQAQTSSPFFLLLTPHAPHTAPGTPPAPIPAPRHSGDFSALDFPRSPNFNEWNVNDKPGLIKALPALNADMLAWNLFEFRKRRETLKSVDDMVGAIILALRANNLENNTYVIFTSDNGWSQSSHRWRGKQLLYEESLRVPLIIRGPGVIANQVRTQLVTNLDLTPTILALAGATPGNLMDGRSLVPLLIGSPFLDWRTGFNFQGTAGLNETVGDSVRISAVRAKNFVFGKLSSGRYGNEEELYDLVNDPYQTVNRIQDPKCAAVATFLRTALAHLSRCAGASCWMTSVPPPSCQ